VTATTIEEPHVLVVDDEPDVLEAIVLLLESCGYALRTARNGVEGLASLRDARPCLILLDLMMPVMDGWEFRKAQLADDALADVPVVVVTGAGVAAQRGGPLGPTAGFLRKPFEADDLLRLVSSHCAAKR
jgi:CheY-like chemotaxis protein